MVTSFFLGAGSILGLAALFVTDPVLVYKSYVPALAEYQGYKGDVLSKMLREHIREIAQEAGTARGDSLGVFNTNESAVDILVERLHLGGVVDSLREFMGLHAYAFQPYLVATGNGLQFSVENLATDQHMVTSASTLKFGLKGETADDQLFYLSTEGGEDIRLLIHELSIKFIERVDPYVLTLYYFRNEYAEGKFNQTFPMIEHSIRVLPHEMKMWPILLWGFAYTRQGRYDDAIVKYRQVLELVPNYVEAMALWGKTLVAKGDTEDGIRMMRHAVRHVIEDPTQANSIYWPTPHVYLGDALAKLSCPEPTMIHCVRVTPEDAPIDDARDAEARNLYVQGLELVPDNPYLKTSLGALYLRHGQFDAAITLLQEAILNHPQKFLVRQLLDQTLRAKHAANAKT